MMSEKSKDEKSSLSDDELYRMFLKGDIAPFEALMLRYCDSLTYYLNGYLHDMHEAEDLMIEAFARIAVKKPHIGEGNFKAYLYKVGHNLACRIHMIRSRMEVFSLEDMPIEPADKNTPESRMQEAESRRILYRCLDRIDSDAREVMWLIYHEGLSYAGTAKVLGVSTKKVDNLLVKGKKKLKSELTKEGVTDAYE